MPFYGTGTVLFEDEFTYSDGNLDTVGAAKWTAGLWTGQPSLRVLSNKAAGPAADSWSDCYSDQTVSLGSNGVEIIWTNITLGGSAGTWTYNHIFATPGGSPSSYWVRWSPQAGYFYTVGKMVSGSFTTLFDDTVQAVNGDDVCLQILPDGTMTLWRKPSGGSWAQIGSGATDTTFTSGSVALESAMNGDRWDAVQVREIPGEAGPVAPTITFGTIVASTDAAAPYTVTATLPAHVADDILIVCAAKNNASDLTCATSGWETLAAAQNSANFSTAWFWKRATSSAEPAPVITSSTAGSTSAGIYAVAAKISGCIATGDPFEDATLNGTPTLTTTPVSSLITTTGEKRLAVAIAAIDDNNTISSGYPPATWTGKANTGSDTGGDAKFLAISKEVASAGDVAAVNIGVQAASDYWRTLTLAFIPIPVSSGSIFKRWNGSVWVEALFKKYDGSNWTEKPWKKLP